MILPKKRKVRTKRKRSEASDDGGTSSKKNKESRVSDDEGRTSSKKTEEASAQDGADELEVDDEDKKKKKRKRKKKEKQEVEVPQLRVISKYVVCGGFYAPGAGCTKGG